MDTRLDAAFPPHHSIGATSCRTHTFRSYLCSFLTIYSVDCVGSIWTQGPEPLRLIGPSLLLTFLVIRHQVSRGCPFPASDTN
jgi:hypothetical protein